MLKNKDVEQMKKMAVDAQNHYEGDEKAVQLIGKIDYKPCIQLPQVVDIPIESEILNKMECIYNSRFEQTKAR